MSKWSSRGKEWEAKREVVLKRAGGVCENCQINEPSHIDHIIPKSYAIEKLGWTEEETDDLENLQALCRDCNLRKGTSLPGERMTFYDPLWFDGINIG